MPLIYLSNYYFREYFFSNWPPPAPRHCGPGRASPRKMRRPVFYYYYYLFIIIFFFIIIIIIIIIINIILIILPLFWGSASSDFARPRHAAARCRTRRKNQRNTWKGRICYTFAWSAPTGTSARLAIYF